MSLIESHNNTIVNTQDVPMESQVNDLKERSNSSMSNFAEAENGTTNTIDHEQRDGKRKAKRTALQNNELQHHIKEMLDAGDPPLAIALRLDVPINTINGFITGLVMGNALPSYKKEYDVVKSGTKIKDLSIFSSLKVDFFHIEEGENGSVLIKPYNVGGDCNE